MARYINADLAFLKIKKRLYETALNNILGGNEIISAVCDEIAKNRIKTWIDEVPTADAVEVVRCGSCKWLKSDGKCKVFADYQIIPSAADFCSYGERREDEIQGKK